MTIPAADDDRLRATDAVPLFVDLDGTVTKSDLGAESALRFVRRAPLNVLVILFWLLTGGRARAKAEIARRVTLELSLVPLQQEFMQFLRDEASRNRPIYLATASDTRIASELAARLGVFCGVVASDGTRNLKGRRKLEAIVEMTGGGPFDYAANGRPDIPIWRHARQALLVNPDASVVAAARGITFSRVFDDRPAPWRSWYAALRLHHWLKNVLLGVPLFTAHAFDATSFLHAALGFIAFGLVASGTYLLNDMLDLDADRRHAIKRRRPFAAGELPLAAGMIVMLLIIATGLIVAALISETFAAATAVYLVLTLAYSLYLKSFVILDAITLAALYTIRIIAGATAIDVEVSSWLLAFSMFVFMSLALVKRCSELRSLAALAQTSAGGRDYRVEDAPVLTSMGVAAAYLSVLVMALFVDSDAVRANYGRPVLLWLECPLLLYWISRLWIKTARGEMNEDPVMYSLRDATSWLVLVLMTIVVLMAI